MYRHLSLVLALVWGVLGVTLLATHVGSPEALPALRVFGTGPSLGWVALALCAYNLVRWWGSRVHERARRAAEGRGEARPPRPRDPEGGAIPNPDFDFGRPADAPPRRPPA